MGSGPTRWCSLRRHRGTCRTRPKGCRGRARGAYRAWLRYQSGRRRVGLVASALLVGQMLASRAGQGGAAPDRSSMVFADLSGWLVGRGLTAADLTGEVAG